jgi:hypothetical protein
MLGRKARKIFSFPENGLGTNFVKFLELPTNKMQREFKDR